MAHIYLKTFKLHSASLPVQYRTFFSGKTLCNVATPSKKSEETSSFQVGDIVHGYKVNKVAHIEELNIRPYLLRHEVTGSEHLHISKENDSNNVFAVSLRTTPKNSTGVAHILEHLALCGSKKYSVRDPFFKMTTRSLATFMNAMTGPDFTVYPFSTQNQRDFENLLSVYTDAVFFPRLRPVDFRQEGWRLEHEKPDRKETPIVIRGVVYNEMKGVFSSSASIYCRQMLNQLFPDTTYRYESGGDPEVIPELGHEELKKFHQTHYHPSNAKFFTYGDFPLENHLKLINEKVMSKFSFNSQAKEKSLVSDQPAWTDPRFVEISCPPDPMTATPEKQTTTSISYMLKTTNTNFEDMFALQLLSSLLIDGPNAPFYRNLIESGIGSDFAPSTGLGSYTRQPYFSVGLQNIHRDDVKKVHDIIEETFKEVSAEGFPQERVEAILHNIELGLKHVSGNFGLKLAMSIESIWNHDGDAIEYFRINELVTKFRRDLAQDKHYWSKLISNHFLNNSHKLFLSMSPDKEFEEKRKERERNLLENKIANLNEVDRQTVLYEGMELMKIQSSKDDPSVLPCLEPSKDIPRDLRTRAALQFETHKGVHIQMCNQPTNEIVYFRALFDIAKLRDSHLIDYLPLFCDVATKLGAGAYQRRDFDQKIRLTTGGLGVSLNIYPNLSELESFRSEVMIGSHCLRKNVGSMFELWSNVFSQIHFQENKDFLFQLVKAAAAELSEGISHAGHSYAIKRSSRDISSLGAIDERLSGLEFVARLKDIASKEDIESIVMKLQSIAEIALDPFNMRCALNAESTSMEDVSDDLKRFIDRIQQLNSKSLVTNAADDRDYEHTKVEDMKFPFATHYVARSLVAVPRLHEDFPKLVILAKLISSKFLLREVREKGGAYGAGARMSNSGIFSFYSYRDPNTDRTLKTFEETTNWIDKSEGYSDRDIEESKLGVFQEVDRPIEPGRRGLGHFTIGETDDMRQEFRQRLLEVSQRDVEFVANKYLRSKKFATHVI